MTGDRREKLCIYRCFFFSFFNETKKNMEVSPRKIATNNVVVRADARIRHAASAVFSFVQGAFFSFFLPASGTVVVITLRKNGRRHLTFLSSVVGPGVASA